MREVRVSLVRVVPAFFWGYHHRDIRSRDVLASRSGGPSGSGSIPVVIDPSSSRVVVRVLDVSGDTVF